MEKGFTLMELLAVMTILIILSAVAIPKFTKVLHDSQVKTNKVNEMLIKTAAEIYWSSESSADSEKAVKLGGTTGAEVTGGHVLITDSYLKDELIDPRNHEPYILKVTNTSPLIIEVAPKNTNGY